MLRPPVEPSSNVRTVGVAVLVVAAHLALFAAYVTSPRSGTLGLREAHAVAPSGPLEVVLLAEPSAVDRPAPAGPVSHAPIHPHLSPAVRRTLPRKPAPTEAVAPVPQAAAPQKMVVARPAALAVGAAGATDAATAASAASAAKAPQVAEAARFSARPEPKRADEVACRVPTPSYPARARRLEEEGTVTVRMTLDTSGHATAVSLERGTGFADLDSAALDAVRDAACEPYLERGEAVPISVVQSIDFKLAGP
ncbi:energy transducer TonB [Trinickia dinghuensis]|uniref:Energy transducer TonB n=2 Tax=Trinickia dinghuensis TaxID=2291023 RepID=A0A3D8JYP6_9BURK|nr:energy transducer TonB [Trinickia dinghuensis]